MGNCCHSNEELHSFNYSTPSLSASRANLNHEHCRLANDTERTFQIIQTVSHSLQLITDIHKTYGIYLLSKSRAIEESVAMPAQVGEMGEVYIGEWKWGKKHGIGTQIWDDGSVYEGEWVQGEDHRKGKIGTF